MTALKILKMAVFAPIPSASDRIATTVNTGLRTNWRSAYRVSWKIVSIQRVKFMSRLLYFVSGPGIYGQYPATLFSFRLWDYGPVSPCYNLISGQWQHKKLLVTGNHCSTREIRARCRRRRG